MRRFKTILSIISAAAVIFSSQAGLLAYTNDDISTITVNYASERYNPNSGVGGFVARLYTMALQRNYDVDGYNNWCDMLAAGELDGANCARGIFYSQEFRNKGYDPDTYLTILYRVFFNREPDTAGFNAWKLVLFHGKSYEEVLEDFINSTEWANVCLSYGIRSGGTGRPTANVSINNNIAAFVNSLYSDVLGRNADSAGFSSWANGLATLQISGKEAARGFFFSPEFINRYNTLGNSDRVRIFYRVFLGREPDSNGLDSWVNILNNGGSLDDLFNGFSDSPEFRNKCLSYGILPVISDNAGIAVPVDKTYIVTTENGGIAFVRGHFDEDAANAIFNNTNNYRSNARVSMLGSASDSDMSSTRQRAVELSYSFGHTRPSGGLFNTLFSGGRAMGENVAYGSASTNFSSVWRNSSGHYSNMIDTSYHTMSQAVFIPEGSSRAYAVQNFFG
ncbi:MAG: DUF4214 domain-containing protein [Clostridiales bacterium]|nr:DUF4214 domain-containing protein [Clostridiales bacterium]